MMKTIGMIGGMSWESSLEYYRLMNEEVRSRLGGSHSVDCLLYSFDFQEVEDLQHRGDWNQLTREMVKQGMNLKRGGAEFLVICTNTMHKMAPDLERETGLRVLHIADATGREIKKRGLSKVLLLGTKFTMEGEFYRGVLKENHGIDVVIPNDEDRELVHRVIYQELVRGKIEDESRAEYVRIIEASKKTGAEGVVLGCTEIPLLIHQKDVSIPVFDTTAIHSIAAVDWALEAE
jgi:aspartate racemase